MVLDFIIELKGDNLTMLCEGKPTSLLNFYLIFSHKQMAVVL